MQELPLLARVEYVGVTKKILGVVVSAPYRRKHIAPLRVALIVLVPDKWTADSHAAVPFQRWMKTDKFEVRSVNQILKLEDRCDLSFALTHWNSRVRELAAQAIDNEKH